MRKYLLYGHGGAYNHGAEAIIRTTVPLLRKRDSQAQVILSTHFPEQDREFGLDKLVDKLIPADLSLVPAERAVEDFTSKELAAGAIYRDALAEIDSDTVCVGVGGDMYCYPNWHRQAVFHHTAQERGGRSILWGCSVQPEMIDKRMAEILREHDHIYARESLTAQALRIHGVKQLSQVFDPAFRLEPEEIPLPCGFCGHAAALNISPLALRRSNSLMDCFTALTHMLLERADTLLLVPHVTMPMDNDWEALRELEGRLTPAERKKVCRAPEKASAAQLKHLISQCEMLVCCRTHSSIAAYSAGVPVLAVSYSVKAQGIGRDLGMERWVLPLEQAEALPALAEELWDQRQTVHRELLRTIANYKKSDNE